MSNYIFTLHPTFTQGLILGQLSVFFLLALILKYLFWDTGPESRPGFSPPITRRPRKDSKIVQGGEREKGVKERGVEDEDEDESLEWLNGLLLHVIQSYRAQLREYQSGPEADEIIRQKVESKINQLRPTGFIDHVKVHSVDIGSSAPRLSRARVEKGEDGRDNDRDSLSIGGSGSGKFIANFDVSYRDTVSISLSTSIVLHHPRPFFARLPIALTLSLVLFSSNLVLIPPDPGSEEGRLTFTLPPDFTLEMETNSLLGSRAKLADVPKVHEMIVSQIRRALIQRGTWTVVLPRIATSNGNNSNNTSQ